MLLILSCRRGLSSSNSSNRLRSHPLCRDVGHSFLFSSPSPPATRTCSFPETCSQLEVLFSCRRLRLLADTLHLH